MKAKIMGFEVIDYVKKGTGEVVQGISLKMAVTNRNVFGATMKEEFVSVKSPYFAQYFGDVLEKPAETMKRILNAEVEVDYDIVGRGDKSYAILTEFKLIPVKV
jgi:hypothetical protein